MCAALEVTAAGLGCAAAPLLEEERDLGSGALVAKVGDPVVLDVAGVRAAFAAGDEPVDPGEVEMGSASRSGSALTNRTAAGTVRRWSIRNA